jgi:hypothetical protein
MAAVRGIIQSVLQCPPLMDKLSFVVFTESLNLMRLSVFDISTVLKVSKYFKQARGNGAVHHKDRATCGKRPTLTFICFIY